MSDDARTLATGKSVALLLVHGFNGEPLDMVELQELAAAKGFATRNLLLPGHGTSPRDLARATWADWTREVHRATVELLATGLPVVLVGHSMGAALSLHEAATNPEVSAVAALCPPLHMYPGEVWLTAFWRFVVPYLPTMREDVFDPGARLRYTRRAYRWTPLAAAHSLFSTLPLVRSELGSVRCPSLVVAARRDHVVPVNDGIETYHLLGSQDKDLLVLERSFHSVTKDVERHQVFERVLQLAARVAETRRYESQLGA